MSSIKAVLFDKDGTLVDFNQTWGPAAHSVAARLARGNDGHFTALLEAIGFVPGTRMLAPRSVVVSDPTPVFARRWAVMLEREPTPDFFIEVDALFAEEVLKSVTPLPAVRETLASLAAGGRPLGVATNDAEENARQQMRHLSFDRWLPFIAGYDSGHGAKPEPGMILAFARHAGLHPAEVALVGDTLHDMHAAKAAGALAVAVLTGLTGEAARAQLAPHADVVINTLDELEAALG